MSVPVYRRNESKLEFYENFFKLRREVLLLLARDFGIKARTYDVNLVSDIYGLNNHDRNELMDIGQRNNITGFNVDKIPMWLIENWRYEIMNILNNIGIAINCANAIYIVNLPEYYDRRNFLNHAIGYCMALQDKLNEIIVCLKDVKLGAYENVYKLIVSEIRLLKALRRSDNKLYKKYENTFPYYNGSFYYNAPPVPPTYMYDVENGSVNRVMLDMCKIVDKKTTPFKSLGIAA